MCGSDSSNPIILCLISCLLFQSVFSHFTSRKILRWCSSPSKSCNTREKRCNLKSTSILCVVFLNILPLSLAFFFLFLLLCFFSYPKYCLKCQQYQEHIEVMLSTLFFFFFFKFENRQMTWTFDLCTGEQAPPAALKATNSVKGEDDDDDQAVCLQREGERETGGK